ncbi:hypothetical protein TGDOM2_319580 [Toxoplasma gondii GAB2-2007-GAL-DOM2]|uniref:Uncharacterized protein n=3 Tax=Toxoplasma gondii TaxID=5811 RepID=V4ZBL9_TOXGV|nr:hypothetical protein TGVEG_319580 [Toxoplasma gondii VEG]KFG31116.1 hypothetical protein TGDOM2_319580 [Toxoplasma gondii GAB2-2007-GAL-DOM2]KFG43659.1 hypothetical protein TGP89_319580 [Toxoplasma gondii p89]CEL72496.1 TPA: hypothetical protein BN1205_010780 [Toxoplasma gondii VEG]
MAFTSANHREEFSCSSHSYSGYSPSFHSSLAYDLSSSLSPGGCSSPVPPLLPSSLLDSPSLSSSSLLPPPLCVGFSPGSSSLSSHISQASSPSSFSSLPLGVASPPLPLTPCANDSPPPCSPPFSSSPLSSSSPSPGASSLLSSSLPPAAFSPSGATPSYAFAALASAASSLSSLPPLGSSSQPAPLTAEEIRALPFLCSRVYVEFSADAALPPEVRLALRYPHGYELGVSGKKPKVGKLEQVAKPEKGREARPRRCKAEDVKENAGANAAKHRKESGGPDADKHTQALVLQKHGDPPVSSACPTRDKRGRNACLCDGCRLARALEEASSLLRPFGLSIVKNAKFFQQPSSSTSQLCPPRPPAALPPPASAFSLPQVPGLSSTHNHETGLAIVPYSPPSLSVCSPFPQASCPSLPSPPFSSPHSSLRCTDAATVVCTDPEKFFAASVHPAGSRVSRVSAFASPASSSPSLPLDLLQEVVTEVKKALTSYVLRGKPPAAPVGSARTSLSLRSKSAVGCVSSFAFGPHAPGSRLSDASQIRVRLAASSRPAFHSSSSHSASPACTEKVPERQGGGRSDVEEEKRGFYSAGERKPGQKTRKEEDSSMFDTDADTMEGWIDAIIQLHDIQNEERQALVVTNHYAGIFSSKRVVLTYTSHEFRNLLLKDPSLSFSSLYGPRLAPDVSPLSSAAVTPPSLSSAAWMATQKKTRGVVNEILQLVPGFALKTLFFDGAYAEVRPLLRLLRRLASSSLSASASLGVNSFSSFASFREAAKTSLPSLKKREREKQDRSRDGRRRPSEKGKSEEETETETEQTREEKKESQSDASASTGQDRPVLTRPLKVLLLVASFPVRNSRVRVARAEIDDRAVEDVTTRRATKRVKIRGSLLPLGLSRLLRAFSLLGGVSLSPAPECPWRTGALGSKRPGEGAEAGPEVQRPENRDRSLGSSEVSKCLVLPDLSLFFVYKPQPHAGAPFADEELLLCSPHRMAWRQFGLLGGLLKEKLPLVYERMRSLFPPASWRFSPEGVDQRGVVKQEPQPTLLALPSTVSADEATDKRISTIFDEDFLNSVREELSGICCVARPMSPAEGEALATLCPLVGARQAAHALRDPQTSQMFRRGLRVFSHLYPYRFHSAADDQASASASSLLSAFLDFLPPQHFVSQHFLHFAAASRSLPAHTDLFPVFRPSWIQEMRILTRSAVNGRSGRSKGFKEIHDFQDFILFLSDSQRTKQEEDLQLALRSALTSRERGSLICSENLFSSLDTFLSVLNRLYPAPSTPGIKQTGARPQSRLSVFAVVTSPSLLARSSAGEKFLAAVCQQLFTAKKEFDWCRGVRLDVHLVSPGWIFECYHTGSLRPPSGEAFHLAWPAAESERTEEDGLGNDDSQDDEGASPETRTLPERSSGSRGKAEQREKDREAARKELETGTSRDKEENALVAAKKNKQRRSVDETHKETVKVFPSLQLEDEVPFAHLPLWGWLLFVSPSIPLDQKDVDFLRRTRGLCLVSLPENPLENPGVVRKSLLDFLQRTHQVALSRIPSFLSRVVVFAAVIVAPRDASTVADPDARKKDATATEREDAPPKIRQARRSACQRPSDSGEASDAALLRLHATEGEREEVGEKERSKCLWKDLPIAPKARDRLSPAASLLAGTPRPGVCTAEDNASRGRNGGRGGKAENNEEALLSGVSTPAKKAKRTSVEEEEKSRVPVSTCSARASASTPLRGASVSRCGPWEDACSPSAHSPVSVPGARRSSSRTPSKISRMPSARKKRGVSEVSSPPVCSSPLSGVRPRASSSLCRCREACGGSSCLPRPAAKSGRSCSGSPLSKQSRRRASGREAEKKDATSLSSCARFCRLTSVISFCVKEKLVTVPGFPGIPVVRLAWVEAVLRRRAFQALGSFLLHAESAETQRDSESLPRDSEDNAEAPSGRALQGTRLRQGGEGEDGDGAKEGREGRTGAKQENAEDMSGAGEEMESSECPKQGGGQGGKNGEGENTERREKRGRREEIKDSRPGVETKKGRKGTV